MEVDTSLGATSANGGSNNGVNDVNVTVSRDQNTSPNNSGEGGGKGGKGRKKREKGKKNKNDNQEREGGEDRDQHIPPMAITR
jgi:hypothetical protein